MGQPLDHYFVVPSLFCQLICSKNHLVKIYPTQIFSHKTHQYNPIQDLPTLAEKNRYWFIKKNSSKGKLKIKIEFLYSSGHPLLEFLELYKNPRVLWNTKLHYIVRHHLDQLKMVEMVSQWPFKMKFQLTRRYQLVPNSNLGLQLIMSQVGDHPYITSAKCG